MSESRPPGPDAQDEERPFFAAFAALRERIVEVTAGFRRSLHGKLDDVRDDEGLGLGTLLGGLMVELLNAASPRGEHEDAEIEEELRSLRDESRDGGPEH